MSVEDEAYIKKSRYPLAVKLILPSCWIYIHRQASWASLVALLILSHISVVTVHNIVIDTINAKRASRWNAKLVPRVRGGMLLNIDIMLAWLRHREEDVGRLFVDLQRVHGNTCNTRVFGEDQILSLDPVVFDYVMNTGFEEFEKGTLRYLETSTGRELMIRVKVQKSGWGLAG